MFSWIGLGVAIAATFISRGMEQRSRSTLSRDELGALGSVAGLVQIESALMLVIVIAAVLVNRLVPGMRQIVLLICFGAFVVSSLALQFLMQRRLRADERGKRPAQRMLASFGVRFAGFSTLMVMLILESIFA